MNKYLAATQRFGYSVRNARGSRRLLVVFLVAAILIYNTRELAINYWQAIVGFLSQGRGFSAQFNLVNNLVFFDVFILVCMVAGGLLLLTLLSGRPDSEKRLFFVPFLRGRPIVIFLVFAPAFSAALVLTPRVLANLFLYHDPGGTFMNPGPYVFWPPWIYIRACLLTSVCLAASLADLAAKSATLRWWSLPFLFVSPQAAPVSLLWWNAAAAWAPSRLWWLWRPVLALGTILLPILAFVQAQPIRRDYLFFEGMRGPRVVQLAQPCRSPSYQVIRRPGQPDLFLRCGADLFQYHRGAAGWELVGDLNFHTMWNRGGFDFQRNRAFIFLPYISQVAEVDIATAPPRISRSVPIEPFPASGNFISLQLISAVDAQNGILFIADNRGEIRAYDEQNIHVLRNLTLRPEDGAVADMMFDDARRQLLVLQTRRLSIFNSPDLWPVAYHSFESLAYGMTSDIQRNRLLVSLPEALRVVALDRNSLAEIAHGDAPAGVRVLAMDPGRRYLFLGAMSGVLETRDADSFRLLGRVRLIPWIHGIEVFPETGELMLSGGEVIPVMWRYLPPESKWNFFDQCLRLFERVLRGRPIPSAEPSQ